MKWALIHTAKNVVDGGGEEAVAAGVGVLEPRFEFVESARGDDAVLSIGDALLTEDQTG